MVDYVGQKRLFIISVIICACSVPASIIFGFYKDNFMYALYFCVGATVLVMVLFGPNWPYLNINKPSWMPDSDVPTPKEKAHDAVQHAQSGSVHKKGPRKR
jgi:hypothetical protein